MNAANTVSTAAPNVSIGIAGWSYPDWNGYVYPPKCRQPLAFIAPYVDMVELNTSFYRPVSPVHAAAWRDQTADLAGFFFTAKLHRDVTHGSATAGAPLRESIAAFVTGLAPLSDAGKLRAALAQYPASFDDRSENAARLERLREAFPAEVPLVVELRHASWATPASLAWLQSLGVSVATPDYPASSTAFSLDACRVGSLGYLRLHGRNQEAWGKPGAKRDDVYDYLYSPSEVDGLVARVRTLAAAPGGAIVVANNHYQGKEVATALEVKAKLQGQPVAVPPLLRHAYPHLAAISKTP